MDYLQQTYFANLSAVCRDGGKFTLRPGGTWSIYEHINPQNKFYFITAGSCRIEVEGRQYLARSGDWFLIPAGVRHSYTQLPEQSFEKYWLHFDLYPNDTLATLLHLPCVVQVGEDRRAAVLFEKLTKANSSDKLTDKLRAKAVLLELLALYVELSHADQSQPDSEKAQRVEQVLSYIQKHLDSPISNKELAQMCHMHPNHFIRYFSQMTGQTPASYVARCRMETARRLLVQTDQPVARIMEQVGLQEPSHFARLFRKYFSATPSQYRKRYG